VFAYNVDGMDIRHFNVHWGAKLPSYFEQGVPTFPGCNGVKIEDWK
jgi:hypothetical protein